MIDLSYYNFENINFSLKIYENTFDFKNIKLRSNKINFFSGNEKDLISRLYNTAKNFNADAIVRITSDCPLVDPIIVDKLVNEFKKTDFQYDIITNCATHTFPHGLDVEVYSFNILEKMYKQINDVELREWFPIYVQKNSNDFKILEIKNESDLSYHRWTLDYPEDYEAMICIVKEMKARKIFGHVSEIITILKESPDIKKLNDQYYFGLGWKQ